MPNQPQASIENSFVGGLKTEFTGLNFPENACTEASNCIFNIIGEVNRRGGINYETNFSLNTQATSEVAINTYKWNNVGGDGSTQIIVTQTGGTLEFYLVSNATIASPLSTQLLGTTVNVSSFLASNAILAFDTTIECQFTDGNGFLFVFHPQCDPFYVTYNSSGQTVTATSISVQIRDFAGLPEPGVAFNFRPATLTTEHTYNLLNQGWGSAWSTTSTTSNTIGTGSFTWVVASSTLPILVGDTITAIPNVLDATTGKYVPSPGIFITGTVTSYIGTSLTITETANGGGGTYGVNGWVIGPSPNYVTTFFNTAKTGTSGGSGGTLLNRFPSNAEQWWWYRDTNITNAAPDGTFKPARTTDYIVLSNFPSPKGSVILPAFLQDRSATTLISGITAVDTVKRPSTGCWFQGRVFYSGINDSQQASGDAPYYTWTEDIYFSKIMEDVTDFGKCYQVNDPTNDKLFNLLPTDGGVVTIQGSGAIYKLFPTQSGILVFAANGIWYLTGSSSVGFAATDYNIVKVSGVQSISGTSYVDVLGWPVFWNEEGIYQVNVSQQGGSIHSPDIKLDVKNLCLGTILSFYNNIPLQSKKYARGVYDPISYVIQWIYRSTNETDVTSRYQFDSMLNINTYKGPFYPYSISNDSTHPWVAGINYVAGPGGSTSPDPIIKYFTVVNNNTQTTWSEENDFTNWLDWNSTSSGLDYTSTFTTGYKLHGSAWRLWQLGYVYMFSNNSEITSYKIRGLWDYGSSGTSGKWSATQLITNNIPNFSNVFRKIKIRGRGLALQLQITSVTGYPFDFAGWSMFENVNASI